MALIVLNPSTLRKIGKSLNRMSREIDRTKVMIVAASVQQLVRLTKRRKVRRARKTSAKRK